MSKAKTNALDALRALIAERQQYEQWISALDAKRDGTPEHVFERVQSDYRARHGRVVTDIGGHGEELQLSISTLSSRLVEVAREEDTRREGLQEAELRAAVGEYQPDQWDQLRRDAEQSLEKVATDRAALDEQLGELRAIQKLSEVGSVGSPTPPRGSTAVGDSATPSSPVPESIGTGTSAPTGGSASSPASESVTASSSAPEAGVTNQESTPTSVAADVPNVAAPLASALPSGDRPANGATDDQFRGQGQQTSSPSADTGRPANQILQAPAQGEQRGANQQANAAAANAASRPRQTMPTPAAGVSSGRPRPDAPKADQAKTLKCPECGTPNYPTEWYCERCGGELATM